MVPYRLLFLALLVCLPSIIGCSSSGLLLQDNSPDLRGGGQVKDWTYPPGCSPPAHNKPMGPIQIEGYYSGPSGEMWTTNPIPQFHATLEYGDGYQPTEDDFSAYIDEQAVPVILKGAEEVIFQPLGQLKQGSHYASIIFWPPASFPQTQALVFEFDNEPAHITALLPNEDKGFCLLFFDKVLDKTVAEGNSNWLITGLDNAVSNVELINGGYTVLLDFDPLLYPDIEAAPEVRFEFFGSRGKTEYTWNKSSSRTGDRQAQDLPPNCSCNISVEDGAEHSYFEREHNAYCYEIIAPPNHCNIAITWELRIVTSIKNANPWDFPDLTDDPYDYDITTTNLTGGGPVGPGFHTLTFNKDANHVFFAQISADCIPEQWPGGEGYETPIGTLGCSFQDADVTPPMFFNNDYPKLMNVDDAVNHIECLIETYDKPANGHAYYITGDRESFIQYLEILRQQPCKLVLVAVAHDNHNLRNYGGPYSLEYEIGGGIQSLPMAWIVRFDAVPVYTDELMYWPDPNAPYYGTYKTDYRQFNEYELIFWVLNDMAVFGGDLSGLEDCDFLRVRIEDDAMNNGHGNWHRSADLKDQALNFYTVLGIKAYQNFGGNYVEADYFDGPSFARDEYGAAAIDFAVAIRWARVPPESVPVSAENYSDPHVPPGCDHICNFYTYRLADRNSEEFRDLSTLFFGGPTSANECDDFYLRGSGVIFQNEIIETQKLMVSDNSVTNDQENDWQIGDWPVLYMSHRDHLLPVEFQDDYSYVQSCDVGGFARALYYGDKRGEYNPDGNMLNVFQDLKLGGTGKVLFSSPQGGDQTWVSVQSEADLFVIDSHGGGFLPQGLPFFGPFHERLLNGEPSEDCTELFMPPDLNGFEADADWLVMSACSQLSDSFIPSYYDNLIATGKLIEVGGYSGIISDRVTVQIADMFNYTMAHFFEYRSYLWGEINPSGTRFVAAWMESHCDLARRDRILAFSAKRARAIDETYKYWIYTAPKITILPGLITIPETYFIKKDVIQ